MMKSNADSFAYYLNKYLSVFLPGERGLATNSILSYRDSFALLLEFLKSEKRLRPEGLHMSFLTRELVVEFAVWLEESRKCSISTRNQRIGVIRAFCKWLGYENPEFLKLSAEVVDLKLKKAPKPVVNYLSVEALQNLLNEPDSGAKNGLRDLTLLALTYDTGARVSEITDLKFENVRFAEPPTVILTGKGGKSRIVPLLPKTVEYLRTYIARWNIDPSENKQQYVFVNRSGEKLSRAGVKYILDKYVLSAKARSPELFPNIVSPHSLRHSKAMHLLQSGVNVVYIRDILGHSNLNTTDRYARADTQMKREALDKAEIEMPQKPLDEFLRSDIEDDMTAWLRSFSNS